MKLNVQSISNFFIHSFLIHPALLYQRCLKTLHFLFHFQTVLLLPVLFITSSSSSPCSCSCFSFFIYSVHVHASWSRSIRYADVNHIMKYNKLDRETCLAVRHVILKKENGHITQITFNVILITVLQVKRNRFVLFYEIRLLWQDSQGSYLAFNFVMSPQLTFPLWFVVFQLFGYANFVIDFAMNNYV